MNFHVFIERYFYGFFFGDKLWFNQLVNQSGKSQLNNRLIDEFQKWFDKRLAWDHLPDYRHVQFIFDTDENTWTPAVFVENS